MDQKFVSRLCADLEERGVEYWLDAKDIRPGDSISEQIEHGLQRTDLFGLCLSKASVRKPWVLREYRAALTMQLRSKGKKPRIVPILINDCSLPPLLLDIRYADFSRNYLLGFDDLCKALGIKPESLVPYKAFIRHIESVEPLDAYLAAANEHKRSDLEHDWAYQMFRLFRDGVDSTRRELEEFSKARTSLRLIGDNKAVPRRSKSEHILLTDPIAIYGGYNLTYSDDVDPYTIARSGFLEAVDKLVRYRKWILKRELYLLPTRFSWPIETFPDGVYDLGVDVSEIIANLRPKGK